MNNSSQAYSVAEACARAQTGRTALYEAIKSGTLVARKRGRRTIILEEDLCRWLQSLPRIAVSGSEQVADEGALL